VIDRLKTRIIETLASSYVAGPELADALRVCHRAAAQGWAATVCPWNDDGDSPKTVVSRYLAAIRAVAEQKLNCYLSVKAPAIGGDFGLLQELLQEAHRCRVRIHFDALDPGSASPTFQMIDRALAQGANVGCTLPSRWRRSLWDAQRVVEWGIPVRLVKRQWSDPLEPDRNPEKGYLALADALAGRATMVAVASHDTRLAREAIERLRRAGTCCELEQLFGLPIRAREVAIPLRVPIRLYVAYGKAWLPYCLSHVKKRPVVLAWMLRDLALGRRGKLPKQVSAQSSKVQSADWP